MISYAIFLRMLTLSFESRQEYSIQKKPTTSEQQTIDNHNYFLVIVS